MTPHPKAASDSTDAIHPISPATKLGQMARLLQRTKGATLDDLEKATGWKRHSIRGAISRSLRARYGLKVEVANEERRGRVYRINKPAKARGAK